MLGQMEHLVCCAMRSMRRGAEPSQACAKAEPTKPVDYSYEYGMVPPPCYHQSLHASTALVLVFVLSPPGLYAAGRRTPAWRRAGAGWSSAWNPLCSGTVRYGSQVFALAASRMRSAICLAFQLRGSAYSYSYECKAASDEFRGIKTIRLQVSGLASLAFLRR